MKITNNLIIDESIEAGMNLEFCYIRSLSSVYVGKAKKIDKLNELIEARFFNDKEEYKIFRYNNELKASHLVDDEDSNSFEKTYIVENSKFGNKVKVKNYLKADEDGQNYIYYSRLSGWEE